MGLETTVNFISDLNPLNPAEGDLAKDGDNHIRLIKASIKQTFPNITGAVTPSHTDLNTRLVPSGVILMWSGSIATIPTGWLLCDGTNGTPNLRDRFIVGAGTTYTVGETGGATHVALAQNELPAHTHTFSGNTGTESAGHTHSGTTSAVGDHQHVLPSSVWSNDPGGNFVVASGTGFWNQNLGGRLTDGAGNHSHSFTTSDRSASHTHTFSGTTSSVGSGASHENRPPYFALAYIMKA
jgi:microcystin-dependent protein